MGTGRSNRGCPVGMSASVRLAKEVLASALAAFWSRIEPQAPHSRPVPKAPSDHLQRPMNLIMPLHRPSLVARSLLTRTLVQATDEILAGLDNVGTIHFARFDIVAGNLCMFSIYDGELSGYVRDFIATIGNAFDKILALVKDPPPLPVGHNVDDFIDWIRGHDAFQMPEQPTGLISRDLDTLPRDTVLALHRHRNVQLGVYRGYPGFSAAQIRHQLSAGW
jgi:hypothetical protein